MPEKYLLLTNIALPSDFMINLPHSRNIQVDYLIHSYEKETEHTGDLRNIRLIQKHIEEGITIIFCLAGNLKLFVVNELLKRPPVKNYSVIFIYSALLDYFAQNTYEFKLNQSAINLLKSSSINSIFVPVLFTGKKNPACSTLITNDTGVNKNYNEKESLISLLKNLIKNNIKLKNQNNKYYLFTFNTKIFSVKITECLQLIIPTFIFNLPQQIKHYFPLLNHLETAAAFKKAIRHYSSLLANGGMTTTDNHFFYINNLKET